MPVNFSKTVTMGVRTPGKSSRNSLFEVGLLVVICVLFFWFIILPKKAEVSLKNSDLSNVQDQENKTAGQLATLQGLINSLPSNSQNIAYLNQALPLDGNVIRLQLLIQSLADSVGVTGVGINVTGDPSGIVAGDKPLLADPFAAQRNLKPLNGTIYVTGSFSQLQALLTKLESSGRLIDVNSLAINQGTAGALSMALTFKAYYFAP